MAVSRRGFATRTLEFLGAAHCVQLFPSKPAGKLGSKHPKVRSEIHCIWAPEECYWKGFPCVLSCSLLRKPDLCINNLPLDHIPITLPPRKPTPKNPLLHSRQLSPLRWHSFLWKLSPAWFIVAGSDLSHAYRANLGLAETSSPENL